MQENNSNAPADASNASPSFGEVPNDSESFRTIPNDSESLRNVPKVSERKENHTLTVREAARMFETAGVARTERSITNWCQPNKSGIARLDAYFDPNERRYFITPQSTELAIQEEKAKAVKGARTAEPVETIPHGSEKAQERDMMDSEADMERLRELEKEVMDLKITNRGKDYFIEQLQKERNGFALERQEYVAQLVRVNRTMGELEAKLLQIASPVEEKSKELRQS